ncbi:SOS response-associated peptidase [Hydrogenophaga flava]|uniref:SOS response-associated peptidase n=1 Tax=Hydrogenophaga flava TaxID=65657 RepID=UPI000826CB25|nr:SOS response-associated peptidase family protein [Hydrogenophaga flava]
MCSNYDACTNTERLRLHFGVSLPPGTNLRTDVWPTYSAPFVRRHPNADAGDDAVPPREALQGLFGLVPHWAGEVTFGRRTYNARSETAAEKPSFRDAWRKGQHCIVPVEAVVEPDWRSGKVIPTKIKRKDGLPMGVAGLWATKRLDSGEDVLSFTMLTVNADDHELFKHFHKPDDEKRMVVILHEHQYDEWLSAPPAKSMEFMRQFPAHMLISVPDPERGKRKR